ncbi:MAG: poly-gamma-glutamate synthase PgsB [Spirochaetales bacterium]|jgi:poly-gamma-glutamate synthase PgsB/CapB
MNSLEILGPALALLIALGGAERAALARARRRVRIRIHVNGTRGKSTTTRLIRAALAEGGLVSFGKTTGTAARFIFPDGTEKTVARRASANIREQITAFRLAKRLGAEAIVLECMALKPEFQWFSEHGIIQSTIGVITNARLDHVEDMGRSPEEIAATLGNTIPEHGILITGDQLVAQALAERAYLLHAEIFLAAPLAGPLRIPGDPDWWAQDAGIALEVAKRCGISESLAMAGMRRAMPDPGAARELSPWPGIAALDASAANDPDSLLELIDEDGGRNRSLLLIYNHRADRAARLESFLHADLPGLLVVTGDRPRWDVLGISKRKLEHPQFVKRDLLSRFIHEKIVALEGKEAATLRIVLCGNTKGWKIYADGLNSKEICR